MKQVTICGVSETELKNGWCYKCGNGVHCEVRTQDWIPEQIYNFCKVHNCLNPFGNNVLAYNELMFLRYLETHPNEIIKRKWLQEIAKEHNIIF